MFITQTVSSVSRALSANIRAVYPTMKWFVGVLFLVVAAVGDHCDSPKRARAGYLSAGSFKSGGKEHTFVVSGDIAMDLRGHRVWLTYNTYGHEGQVWVLYSQKKVYVKAGERCYEHAIPDKLKDELEEMDLGKNVHFLKRGRPADFCQRVNVYGVLHRKANTTVDSLVSVTDNCLITGVTFKVEGNGYSGLGQTNLFDVDLQVDDKTFEVPSDCFKTTPTPHGPDAGMEVLQATLFR